MPEPTAPVTAEGLRERIDLPARMAEAMRRHDIEESTHAGYRCSCGQTVTGWDEHLAAAAMSVRWEDAAALAAENADLRARLHEAAGNAVVYHERMASAQNDRDRHRAGAKAATERAELAEAKVERLRAELADASDALCAVGKAALVVAPALAKPYPDAPKTSPWQQFMERPVRAAYNLGVRLRRELKEARDAR